MGRVYDALKRAAAHGDAQTEAADKTREWTPKFCVSYRDPFSANNAPRAHLKIHLQAQLNDPRINALMARAETIVDPQQRFAAWARIDQLVTKTAVAIPWLWETFPTLFSSNVTKVPELWNLGAPDVTFMEVTG